MAADEDRTRMRVLRFLAHGPALLVEAAAGGALLLEAGERGAIALDRKLLARLDREGLAKSTDGRVVLTAAGQVAGKRGAPVADDSAVQNQHRDVEARTIDTGAGREAVMVNWSESPLGQLMRRKTRDGAPFLRAEEFEAGERLRSDYTRGQIMPRMSANWVASVSSGRRAGGVADLTDAALAARQRVERAIIAVGPELSGILIDVCCFLKGMETVEAERGWPVRSAKIVLKTALGVLSRHYNPAIVPKAGPRTLHWGSADYRPSLG